MPRPLQYLLAISALVIVGGVVLIGILLALNYTSDASRELNDTIENRASARLGCVNANEGTRDVVYNEVRNNRDDATALGLDPTERNQRLQQLKDAIDEFPQEKKPWLVNCLEQHPLLDEEDPDEVIPLLDEGSRP